MLDAATRAGQRQNCSAMTAVSATAEQLAALNIRVKKDRAEMEQRPPDATQWAVPPDDVYDAAKKWVPTIVRPTELFLLHDPLLAESEMRENLLCATIPQCVFELLVMKALFTKTADAYHCKGDVDEHGGLTGLALARFVQDKWRDWAPRNAHWPFLMDMVALARSVHPVSGPGVDHWSADKAGASVLKMDANIYIKRALDIHRCVTQRTLYIENVGEPRISRWYRLARQPDQCRLCGDTRDVKPCAGCKVACYCDRVCQKADWASHRATCKAVRARRLFPQPK